MRKIVIIVVALVVIISAVLYFATRRKGPDNTKIKVSGNIEVTEVQASFKVPGRVKERLIDEGETVTVGQVLARLDDEDFAHELAQRQKGMQALSSSLEELETGSRREEIAQADAAVKKAQAEAARLEKDFARQQQLYRKEVISTRELDAARAAHEAAQATLREAIAQQALVREGPRRERIDVARARLQEAREAVAEARTRRGYTVLTSPVAGIVMSKNIEPGEQVAAGTPIVTIGEMDKTWLRAYIGESDLGRVKIGQKARIKCDTYPDKTYEGTVSFISSEAEFTPKNVQTEKERVKLVYRIKITIPNPKIELKPGMPADAEIVLQ